MAVGARRPIPAGLRLAPLLLASLAADAASEGAAGSSKVVELTAADLERRLGRAEGSPWFVKFYAPWCGHCRSLEPVWEKLARRLEGKVHVARVDASRDSLLMDEWGVDGFPTLQLVAEGRAHTYDGPRRLESLEAFARLGWKGSKGEVLPIDKPASERLLRLVFSYAWTYGLPLALIGGLGLVAWMCWSSGPTEEQRARRKAFEEKLAAAERRLAQKHAEQRRGEGGAPAVEGPTGGAAVARDERADEQADDEGEAVAGEKPADEKKAD
mmetsp:Transcript_53209/g.164932  ORF Transcript_53209/g.164932 Transcript_53209/m.164932 type:complete len:270 (-) Transcript_53209:167-976(-)